VSPNYANDQALFTDNKNGLYKSQDGGLNLTRMDCDIKSVSLTDIVLAPNYATDKTIYADTLGYGVFVSPDDGNNDGYEIADMGVDEYIYKEPDVKVSLKCNNPIIKRSESLIFNVEIQNQTDQIKTVYFVSFLVLPEGDRYPVDDWLYNPIRIRLQPIEKKFV
jgi:hypothetical protein